MSGGSKALSHPHFRLNQSKRGGVIGDLPEALAALVSARLGLRVTVEKEDRKGPGTTGKAFLLSAGEGQFRARVIGTVNELVRYDGGRRTNEINRTQVGRFLAGGCPVRVFGGHLGKHPGMAPEDAPITDSQLREILDPSRGGWDYYFVGWRHPRGEGIIELTLIDLDVLRALVNARGGIDGGGVDDLFPRETASTNPDGTVKRYCFPFHAETRFKVQLVWASSASYPGEIWSEVFTPEHALQQQELLGKKVRRRKVPEPDGRDGLLSSVGADHGGD